MFLRFEELVEKRLIGKSIEQSFIENKTFELWRTFMPIKHKITNLANNYLYSLEIYSSDFFNNFDPSRKFTKWAAVEVNYFSETHNELSELILPKGLYAVFLHKGPASDGPRTYNYIFKEWLPASGYLLDDRPHFAQMGEKYKNDSPDSEEEIFIPIKKK